MYKSKKSIKRVSIRSIVPYSTSLYINREELLVLTPGEIIPYDTIVVSDIDSSGYNLDLIEGYMKEKIITVLCEETSGLVLIEDDDIVINPNPNIPQSPPIKISTDVFKYLYLNSFATASVTTYDNATYNWTISNGNIISGQGTFTIKFNATTAGLPVVVSCSVVTDSVTRSTSTTILGSNILPAPTPVTISITPYNVEVTQNTSVTLTAHVSGNVSTDVTWYASAGTFVEGPNNTMVYTAPDRDGIYSVTATSVADPTKTAVANIHCTKVEISLLPSSSKSVQVLDTLQYTAIVKGTIDPTVIWTVDGIHNGNLTVGTIIGSGNTINYMAPYFTGTHTIKATSAVNPTKYAAATITCVHAPVLDVFVFPSNTSIQASSSLQMTANVTVAGPGSTDVIWKVNGVLYGTYETGTVSVSSNSNSVVYYAPPFPGTYKITATSVIDPNKYFTSTIVCTEAPVVAVTLIPSTPVNTFVGGSLPFNATVINTIDTSVVWKVNNVVNGNETVGFITHGIENACTYRAPKTPGIYTISATSVADPTKHTSTTIVCSAIPIVVSVSPTTANIPLSDTLQLTVDVTGSGSHKVIWTVDGVVDGNTIVGSISKIEGTLSYIAPETEGVHTITATSVEDSSKSDSAIVNCLEVVDVQISLTPYGLQHIPIMTSLEFTAGVTGTSNTLVAWTVDGIANGNATVGTITSFSGNTQIYTAPSGSGTRTITVTSVADPTKSASTLVDCQVIPITISLTPVTPSATFVEETTNFTSLVIGSGSHEVVWDVNGVVDGNASVGTITGTGATRTYTGSPGTGDYTITITSVEDPTKTDSATITLNAVPITVALIPTDPANANRLEEVQFTAIVAGTGIHDVVWTVDGIVNGDVTVGTITGSGNTITYTASDTPGTYVIMATSVTDNTKSDSSSIIVVSGD